MKNKIIRTTYFIFSVLPLLILINVYSTLSSELNAELSPEQVATLKLLLVISFFVSLCIIITGYAKSKNVNYSNLTLYLAFTYIVTLPSFIYYVYNCSFLFCNELNRLILISLLYASIFFIFIYMILKLNNYEIDRP